MPKQRGLDLPRAPKKEIHIPSKVIKQVNVITENSATFNHILSILLMDNISESMLPSMYNTNAPVKRKHDKSDRIDFEDFFTASPMPAYTGVLFAYAG